MSWTPTDEQREQTANAAASAENEHFEGCGNTHSVYEHIADAVLVAVGPMIAAQAQREAARSMREYIGRDESTPYIQGWNRALEVVADRIEKEAGR